MTESWNEAGVQLKDMLRLSSSTVAVSFHDNIPDGVRRIERRAASGCSYWKLAAAGETFATDASDHLGCPIGAYTHAARLPEESSKELEGMIGLMGDVGYISADEVPGIPRRSKELHWSVYAPLENATQRPDLVLIHGTPRQIMLVAEAAIAAGIEQKHATMLRPACAVIPVAEAGEAATSLGCIGNRVYTGLADDEMYFAVPGLRIGDLVAHLQHIVSANFKLEEFHRNRLQAASA